MCRAKMIRAYSQPRPSQMMPPFTIRLHEWGRSQRGSMMSVYQDMLLQGESWATACSSRMVIINGATFPMVDSFGANVSIEWSRASFWLHGRRRACPRHNPSL